ncbi:hypothetical protein P9695_14900 [Weizmannia sp. CD-2023]|uniref:hypothetical protein n=1 Tax=Heyndrickxia TaxID=2837504 RepID=UPI002E1EF94E|nr:hypothetical protein [Weizmannia sp. CD-2023]MED4899786.1 hypothetical protein [Weizmannia sp. CD-2023]
MFVIVNKETGEILDKGSGVYKTHLSAVKARSYFLKDYDGELYEIVELSKGLMKILMELQKGSLS